VRVTTWCVTLPGSNHAAMARYGVWTTPIGRCIKYGISDIIQGVDQAPNPLVADIARRLLDDGAFVVHVETGEFGTAHLQAIVDVGWAARQVGRLLDRSVRVTTALAEDAGGVIVTAEFADA
jgi:hypothetical protein